MVREVRNRAIMITPDVVLGEGVGIFQPELVNLYGCAIGGGTKVGAFVEIQKGASVGWNVKILQHRSAGGCPDHSNRSGDHAGAGRRVGGHRHRRCPVARRDDRQKAPWSEPARPSRRTCPHLPRSPAFPPG